MILTRNPYMESDGSRPSNKPYPIDAATLAKAAKHWQAIVDYGAERHFHDELNRRLRFDPTVYGMLGGNAIPPGSAFWADSFGGKLAGILDAPKWQCVGAAFELLPFTRRAIALQLLSEMAAEVSVKNATSRKASYPRRAS